MFYHLYIHLQCNLFILLQSFVESMVGSGVDFTFEFAWIKDGRIRDNFLYNNQTRI